MTESCRVARGGYLCIPAWTIAFLLPLRRCVRRQRMAGESSLGSGDQPVGFRVCQLVM